jgi:hypothetical protein
MIAKEWEIQFLFLTQRTDTIVEWLATKAVSANGQYSGTPIVCRIL